MTAPHTTDKVGEVLAWYAEQVADCRKLGSIGDPARNALDADGGKRARDALAALASSRAEGEESTADMLIGRLAGRASVAEHDDRGDDAILMLAASEFIHRLVPSPRHHDSGVVGSPVQPEGEAVATLIAWARANMAFPVGNPGGEGWGHIDENARFRLRDMVAAIDAMPPQPEGVKPSLVADCVDMGTPQPREDAIAEIVEKRGVMRAEAERRVDASGVYAVQPEGVKRP